MSISTHVLDTAAGRPAAGVAVRLDRQEPGGGWAELASGHTGPDGRLAGWLADGQPAAGVHRLTFGSGGYFARQGVATLYPEITITFEVAEPGGHYHLPVLLTPFGFTTYRGV